MKALTTLFLTVAAIAASCSPFSPDLGSSPYKCSMAEPRCPDGYSCVEGNPNDPTTHNCVSENGAGPDSGPNLQCIDDSGFGMNDSIDGAFQTPVAGSQQTMSIASAICPASRIQSGRTLAANSAPKIHGSRIGASAASSAAGATVMSSR